MAQAAGTIPSDEDRWRLNQAFDHLTELGYTEKRALREMERERLAKRLLIKVQKVVEGKPEGDPFYLPFDEKHELVYRGGHVSPVGLPWGNFDFRCTVYRQRVLELWPPRPPASQTAPVQQAEDKSGPDSFRIDDGRAALPATDPPKPTKPTIVWITAEARQLKADGEITKGMSKTELASLLEHQSQGAAEAGKLKKPLTLRYIRNQLDAWGLWPISSIK